MRIRQIFECNLYKISLFATFDKIIYLQYDSEILKFTGHGLCENFNFEVKFVASLQNLIPKFRNFMK